MKKRKVRGTKRVHGINEDNRSNSRPGNPHDTDTLKLMLMKEGKK